MAMITLKYNFWILDNAIDICTCNQYQLFMNFIDFLTTLSNVTFAGISLSWETVTLTLALDTG